MNDALTGLPTAPTSTTTSTAKSSAPRSSAARWRVVGIDLDRFKEINDL